MPYEIDNFDHRPHVIPNATETNDGVMSAADKLKLDSIKGAGSAAFYGDGSDGPGTFDGVATPTGSTKNSPTSYTLNRDVNYTTLNVSVGVTVHTNGFRLLSNVFGGVNNGTIDNSGSPGAVVFPAGAPGASGSTVGGAAGGLIQGNGSSTTNSLGGQGGNGGNAGKTGTGGSATRPLAVAGGWNNTFSAFWGVVFGQNQIVSLTGGAGGGGGQTNEAGTGGGGGGAVVVTNPSLINNGVISANGGAGGSGDNGQPTPQDGGGGGGGGWVGIVTNTGTVSGSGTITATGGAAGPGTKGGANGTAGANGTVLLEAA